MTLIVLGAVLILLFRSVPPVIAGRNVTSLALLASGLVFYTGVLIFVSMSRTEIK
jgi:hypothetical protein